MLTNQTAYLCEVHVGEAPVVRPASRHHHMVCGLQAAKESFKRNRIRGIEGRSAQRIDVTCGALETLRISPGQNDLCSLLTRTSRCFKADASATSDHDDGLPEEFRFAVNIRGDSCSAHSFSDQKTCRISLGYARSAQLRGAG